MPSLTKVSGITAVLAAAALMSPSLNAGSVGCNILWTQVSREPPSRWRAAVDRFRRACPDDARSARRPIPINPKVSIPSHVDDSNGRRIANARKTHPVVARKRATGFVRVRSGPHTSSRSASTLPTPAESNTQRIEPLTLAAAIDTSPVVVLPVGYRTEGERLTIRGAVTIRGIPSSTGLLPEIGGHITVYGHVAFENVALRGSDADSVLQVMPGGRVSLRNSIVAYIGPNSAEVSPLARRAAVAVSGGYVTVDSSIIGPGFSQAASIVSGTLIIRGSSLRNPGKIVIGAIGGVVDIRTSSLAGGWGLSVQGESKIAIYDNHFLSASSGFPIVLRGVPSGSVTSNRIALSANNTWICMANSVGGVVVEGNVRLEGGSLPLASRSDIC